MRNPSRQRALAMGLAALAALAAPALTAEEAPAAAKPKAPAGAATAEPVEVELPASASRSPSTRSPGSFASQTPRRPERWPPA